MKRALLLILTFAWWSIVLFSSGPRASGGWTERLLHDLFGLSGQLLHTANFLLRKTGHVFYYFTLTGLLGASLRRRTALACLLALATGVFDEVRQSFSQGRTGTASDLLYDGAGIALMALLYLRKPASE